MSRAMTVSSQMIAAGLFAAAPLSVVAGLGLAPLLGIIGLAAFAAWPRGLREIFRFPAVRLFALLMLWALLSAAWSIRPQATLRLWLTFAPLCLLGFLVFAAAGRAARRKTIAGAAMYGYCAAMLLALAEIAAGGAANTWFRHAALRQDSYVFLPEALNRAACVLALMFWPFLLAFLHHVRHSRSGYLLAALMWVAVLGTLLKLESLSAVLGHAVGSMVFPFGMMWRGRLRGMLAALMLLGLATVPAAVYFLPAERAIQRYPGLPASAQHRLHIWDFSLNKIMENKILGYGLNASRHVPGGAEKIRRSEGYDWQYLPLHPHNNAIQLWLELGVTGLLLWLGFAAALLLSILRTDREAAWKAAALALAASYLAIGMTAFGVWQYWWAAAGFLSAAGMAVAGYDASNRTVSQARASAQN